MTELQFLPLQTKFRQKFKQIMSSHRPNRSSECRSTDINMSLAQFSRKSKEKQQNKRIHTLSKQTFITTRKQHLLTRKFFYNQTRGKNDCQQANYLEKQCKKTLYQNLTESKSFEDPQIFKIQNQVMKNPFDFHRKMITRISNDIGVRKVLNQWYEDNVADRVQKLHQIQAKSNQRPFSLRSCKQKSNSRSFSLSRATSCKQKIKNPKQLPKKSFFNKSKIQECQNIKVNQNVLNKYLTATKRSQKDQNLQRLTKIMVKIQPFWYKVRLKI